MRNEKVGYLDYHLVLDTCIVRRGDCHKLCFDSFANIQCLDEFVNSLLCHLGVCTSESLECFVRMWISFTTKNGLYGFCYDSPCVVKVSLKSLLVEDKLAQTLECALDGDNAMTKRSADVTENGRVGKIALQTTYRKLSCKELKNSVCDTEVTFRVLEVNRIDLMRHSA